MNSKERVLKALNKEKTDRVPIYATVTPQIGDALCNKFGIPKLPNACSPMFQRIVYVDVLNRLGNDCVGVAASYPKDYFAKTWEDGSIEDEWGIRWKSTGMYNEMSYHPLSEVESISDLDKFTFPNPNIINRYELPEKMIRQYGKEYAMVGMQDSICFEAAWYIVGLEKFMMDLVNEKGYVFELLDKILEIKTDEAKQLIKCGVDFIWTGDDVGDQNGMMISPNTWRKILKPRLAKYIDDLYNFDPKIKIAYHSCGSILPIIPDLIEIGLDILNPLQPNAKGMNPRFLKKEYGDKLCFFGGIDVQRLLPQGNPEQIKNKVKEIVSILSENNGYIMAPAHNIQPDTPLENIFAMFEAINN
jgi:uroporphyrinogen decarboxylase